MWGACALPHFSHPSPISIVNLLLLSAAIEMVLPYAAPLTVPYAGFHVCELYIPSVEVSFCVQGAGEAVLQLLPHLYVKRRL